MAKDLVTILMTEGEAARWSTFRPGRRGDVQETARGQAPLSAPAETDDGEGVASASEVLRKLKSRIDVVVPESDVILRVLRLPTDDPSEIGGMVELQVETLSPFPADQVVTSHETVSQGESTTTVIVAIAKLSALNELRSVLGDPEFGRVDAEPLGLWHGFVHSGQLAESGRELLATASSEGVQFIVHEGGLPLAMTYVAGPFDLASEDDCREIAWEASRLLMSLEVDAGAAPKLAASVWAPAEFSADIAARIGEVCGMECYGFGQEMLPDVFGGVARRGLQPGRRIDLTPPAWRASEASARFKARVWSWAAAAVIVWKMIHEVRDGALGSDTSGSLVVCSFAAP